MRIIKNSLGQGHEYIEKVVCLGDTVVDATAGNGHDTAFLANLVGPDGKVYSFDIQKKAIENTRKRLIDSKLLGRVELICDGHENLDNYVKEEVKTVVFNLGYLPGGDHKIGTVSDTTIKALDKSLNTICINGLLVMVVYYGGDSGFDEKNRVLEYIKSIDNKKFTVAVTEFVNQSNCPPILVCIERLN